MPYRLLIAEDSQTTRKQMERLLELEGAYQVDTVGDGKAALEALTSKPYQLFLTDLRMPGLDGMQLVEEIRQRRLPVTVIVMTGYASVPDAVQAIRLGAYDFLPKPVDPDHLKLVLERALRERGLQEEVVHLREELRGQHAFHGLLSKSALLQPIFELIRNVSETTTTVLIQGETGTGKEMVARAIHEASAALRKGSLVAVNCAALPENLLESELFGHEKGAFTGAIGQRKGRFELADGGTIFLDEIGDLPPLMQAKLLRVLQERCFERVGGSQSIPVDVRVVAATNRDLQRLVRKGKFREDLYYRLNVVRIDLPPLRDRPEDIPLLAAHFAGRYVRPGQPPPEFSPQAMERLLQHSWPGNIRELENAVERACITARSGTVEPDDLLPEASPGQPTAAARSVDVSRPLPDLLREMTQELEKEYLKKALRKCGGHVGKCADLAGLSRRSIAAKLTEYKIDKSEFKKETE
jgi:DNA-binding NtrC family response regulator